MSAVGKRVLRGLPGLAATSPAFKIELCAVAERLGVDADWLATIIGFETQWTWSPYIKNARGSGAIGLIQFMGDTAKRLGTTTAALGQMTAVEQLAYVEKYFRGRTKNIRRFEDLYLLVLWPVGVGTSDDHLMWEQDSPDTGKAYAQNVGFDRQKRGYITTGDVVATIRAAWNRAIGTVPVPIAVVGSGIAVWFLLVASAGWFLYRSQV